MRARQPMSEVESASQLEPKLTCDTNRTVLGQASGSAVRRYETCNETLVN
jgi:hypothetical protein